MSICIVSSFGSAGWQTFTYLLHQTLSVCVCMLTTDVAQIVTAAHRDL